MHVQNSFIQNSTSLEIAHMMNDKHLLIYPYQGMLFSNETKNTEDTHNHLDEI